MGYCAALYCRNASSGVYKNSSVSFYGFPLQNKPLLWRWIQNMGRDMDTPSKYQCLCSEHFEESSFEVDPLKTRKRRRLLKEAVPNKFILGKDGTWLVGTPQAFGDAMSSKTRKRIRNSGPCGVPGMFPVWPRLQDWQNEFYKQLLKEKKYGSLITLGKVPHCHNSDQAGTSRNRHNPATNPANPTRIRSGNNVLAGQELDEFRQFLLYHQGQPKEVTVPWFICTECGKSFARHAYLVRHLRAHAGLRPVTRGNSPSTATSGGIATSSTGHEPAWGAALQSAVQNPALPRAGGL